MRLAYSSGCLISEVSSPRTAEEQRCPLARLIKLPNSFEKITLFDVGSSVNDTMSGSNESFFSLVGRACEKLFNESAPRSQPKRAFQRSLSGAVKAERGGVRYEDVRIARARAVLDLPHATQAVLDGVRNEKTPGGGWLGALGLRRTTSRREELSPPG